MLGLSNDMMSSDEVVGMKVHATAKPSSPYHRAMSIAKQKVGAGETALALLIALLVSMHSPLHAADTLPVAGDFLGEIRRDASGQLIVVPPAKPDASSQQAMTEPVAGARTIHVGPGHAVKTIAAAAALAKDGDTVEIDAGDYRRDVAVWKQDRLTIRGMSNSGEGVKLIADGASAEGKAIWVMRGGAITVENIEFSEARVADKNGAGIRFEKGRLVVRKCRFVHNENGILTSGGDAELDIVDSEFGHNGHGDGYSHNLYVGALRRLRVTGSYFHHAHVGHLLKSRAAENHILYNRLSDESGGRASYELEFPNGGVAYVIGNIIEQSATTENPTIISFGAEGYKGPKNELYLINNTIDNNRPAGATFLNVKPGAQIVKAYNNLLIGKGPLNNGINGEFINNPNVDWDSFVLAQRHDYRVNRSSPLQRSFRAPGSAGDIDLTPSGEYVHPATSRPLLTMPTLPGARQTLQP
jgi:hypothetical protein